MSGKEGLGQADGCMLISTFRGRTDEQLDRWFQQHDPFVAKTLLPARIRRCAEYM